MDQMKISPKLMSLCRWKYINEVNKRLDDGESPLVVVKYINKMGFEISHPMVYEYQKLRKKALIDGINVEQLVGLSDKPLIDLSDPQNKTTSRKLKSEIEALDILIEAGYNTLIEQADRPIPPKLMMDAIKLKYELTDGSHGFLTNYGMAELKELEQKKYQLLMEHLIRYIPKDKQKEAVDKMSAIEDEYYQGTQYYEEYVKSLDISDKEKQKKLKAYQAKLLSRN